MRKRLLSLALVLVLCLGLTVPAMAAESKWKLEIPGKSDAQASLGKRTFTVRDWAVSDTYEEEYDTGSIWTKTASRQWTAENVYAMSKGDMAVFTKGGESFQGFYMKAWSDQDGDGVYDMRIVDLYGSEIVVPAGNAGPVRTLEAQTEVFFYMPNPEVMIQHGATPSEYGCWDPVATGGISSVTELKMSPDFLLEIYGPNTIVNLTTIEGDWSCTILVEGKDTQPAQPQQPAASATAAPTNDSLTVDGTAAEPTVYKIDGSNYFKIRDVAALLNGTEKQFAVGYDNAAKSATATTGQPYEKQEGDLAGAAGGGSQSATPSTDSIYVDGVKIDAQVYKIGGSNYFKLRDLGKALNFYVGWSREQGMFIDTSKPYSE